VPGTESPRTNPITMESNTDQFESLFEKTQRYAQTSFELYRLKFIAKSADIVSTFAARLAVVISAISLVLMINIGVALWLGDILGKSYYGFLVVSGFYALTTLLFYLLRNRWIKTSVKNVIIEQAIS
jgi:hypothetical protein